MERQNITLSLPRALVKKAKIVAATEEKSLSELLRQALEERVRESEGYARARIRQLRILKKGLVLGTEGKAPASREELHDRR